MHNPVRKSHTKLMGVVNVTPDSFSDGGKFLALANALAQISQLVADGADIIDLGAESTRPGALPVTAQQEWERLEPVLQQALARFGSRVHFSVDTRHAETARRALQTGNVWINDVTGFADPAMRAAVRDSDGMLVMMHSLTVPANPAVTLSEQEDIIAQLVMFARERIALLEREGISRQRMIFDPGIGFGKTAAQSRRIMESIALLKEAGVALLIGHSRKSFLGLADASLPMRDAATREWSAKLIAQGVDYLRVHDVAGHKQLGNAA